MVARTGEECGTRECQIAKGRAIVPSLVDDRFEYLDRELHVVRRLRVLERQEDGGYLWQSLSRGRKMGGDSSGNGH